MTINTYNHYTQFKRWHLVSSGLDFKHIVRIFIVVQLVVHCNAILHVVRLIELQCSVDYAHYFICLY